MDRMHIQITGVPKPQVGEPDFVRKAWVGLVLPVEELREAIFSVRVEDALHALEYSPEGAEAAKWLRGSEIMKPGRSFTFSCFCCEVVAAPEYRRVTSIP